MTDELTRIVSVAAVPGPHFQQGATLTRRERVHTGRGMGEPLPLSLLQLKRVLRLHHGGQLKTGVKRGNPSDHPSKRANKVHALHRLRTC